MANSLWFDYEFTIFLRIHFNLTINPLPIFQFTLIWQWIHYLFRNKTMILPLMIFFFFSWILYDLTINSLSFCEFSIIWLWIHYFLMNSLWFDYESTIGYATSLWIYCLFRDKTMNSLSLSEFTMNWLWIHSKYLNMTINLPSFWQNNYEFTMIYANSLWIHY